MTSGPSSDHESREAATQYVGGVLEGDRRSVAKTITLLESRRAEHVELGRRVLELLVPHSGSAMRVGISGPPGVGKSTTIEALGLRLIDAGHRVAVLAVDPSSPVSGGSILGDKTRMSELSLHPDAYIRPSPSGGTLGGVAHRTREAMLVCEAAGFDVVLVETVGVGQSEAEVASMVDFFLVLLQPGGGDDLQGIKKGVLELADALAVNKADGPYLEVAKQTQHDYTQALMLLRTKSGWQTPVLSISAQQRSGLDALWEAVLEHRSVMTESGDFEARRREQAGAWLWRLIRDGLENEFRSDQRVAPLLELLEKSVTDQETSPPAAARQLLDTFRRGI